MSSVFAALQCIRDRLLVSNPPRVYILLLLVSLLLVLLVEAGIFDEGDVHCAGMYEKCAGSEPNSGLGPGFSACAVAVSEAEEELEIGIAILEEEYEQKSDRVSCPCMDEEPNVIKYQDDKESTIEEEGEEDVEDLHIRIEAYIRKVQMRFTIENHRKDSIELKGAKKNKSGKQTRM